MTRRLQAKHWLLLLVVIAALAPVPYPATGDELFTWWTCQHGLNELLRIVSEDVHPPLYYLLARAWAHLAGHSILALRLLSGLFGLASIIGAGYLYTYEFSYRPEPACHSSRHKAWAIWLLLAFNATTLAFSHWARMYTLMAFLGVAASFLALHCLRHPYQRWNWAFLTVVAACLVSTHHYSAVFVAAMYIWLFVETLRTSGWRPELLRAPSLSVTISAVVTLPIALIAIRQATQVCASYWIQDAGFSAPAIGVIGYFFPLEHIVLPAIGCFAALALALVVLMPVRLPPFGRFFVCQIVAISIVIAGATIFGKRPILVSRYLNTLHSLACVFFVSRIDAIPWPSMRRYAFLFLVINTALGTALLLARYTGPLGSTSWQDPHDYRAASVALDRLMRHGATVVCVDPLPFLRYHFYADRHQAHMFFWNPQAVEESRMKHQVFLSAIPPDSRLSDTAIREVRGNILVLVDDLNVDIDIPGWSPTSNPPIIALPKIKVRFYARTTEHHDQD